MVGKTNWSRRGAGIVHTQADLDLAARHVREGEERLVRQELLLTRLRAAGHPTALAESILANYSDVLEPDAVTPSED
jgi:hypothetical protein